MFCVCVSMCRRVHVHVSAHPGSYISNFAIGYETYPPNPCVVDIIHSITFNHIITHTIITLSPQAHCYVSVLFVVVVIG